MPKKLRRFGLQFGDKIRFIKNMEFLTAFYIIPEEIIKNTCPSLMSISRNIYDLFHHPEQIALIESDYFELAIIDIYAYLVWLYLGISPYMEIYSGYDPIWILAHAAPLWIETMIEEEIILSIPDAFQKYAYDKTYRFESKSLYDMEVILKYSIMATVQKHNLGPVLECIEQNRCWEDFDKRDSKQKTDFFRKWYHSRTAHPMISLEQYQEEYAERNDGKEFDIPDGTDVEDEAVTQELIDSFMKELTEKQKQILNLRLEGRTYEEIAQRVGYKTHSAVVKQMDKIGQKFETFAGVDYGFNERAQKRKASAKK